jgi:2-C-methyl-D-erythritol 4-phosphate cytidylyltransferase
MGAARPKQFLPVGGVPILGRTVGIFEGMRAISDIVVVAPAGYLQRARRLVRKFSKVIAVVAGGPERQDSVWLGLQAFPRKPDIVLVHDAVRSFVDAGAVRKVIRGAERHGGAALAVRVSDTVKVGAGFFKRTLPRDKLWAAQTPQGFRYELLLKAHLAARKTRFSGTDEASLAERVGIPVKIVEGDSGNTKITTREDLKLAELRLKRR